MPLQTVGSDEALLCIIAKYTKIDNEGISVNDLWREIADYQNGGGRYRFYMPTRQDQNRPDGKYLGELSRFIERGDLEMIAGKIVSTVQSHYTAYRFKLPAALDLFEKRVLWLAETRVEASQN